MALMNSPSTWPLWEKLRHDAVLVMERMGAPFPILFPKIISIITKNEPKLRKLG